MSISAVTLSVQTVQQTILFLKPECVSLNPSPLVEEHSLRYGRRIQSDTQQHVRELIYDAGRK